MMHRRFRIWPPIALGVPLLVGVIVTASAGDPFSLAPVGVRALGLVLSAFFALWNGWTFSMMVAHRTAVLPGSATDTVLNHGPFRFTRNPLYLGLIALGHSSRPCCGTQRGHCCSSVGVALLFGGAIAPEERYLSAKFGAEYDAYRERVRRWL